MKSDPKKLIKKHQDLTHTENVKVSSHVQRKEDDWVVNTVMIEDCTAAFKYKRKKQYKSLAGARVNITYYPSYEVVGGMEFEIMNVVRIKVA
jgi:hypothetical protein